MSRHNAVNSLIKIKILYFLVVNECELAERPLCEQKCLDLLIGYRCDCEEGYTIDKTDLKSCQDVNECDGRFFISLKILLISIF